MRRAICKCEPTLTRAGERKTYKFSYIPVTALPKGTILKFDPLITMGKLSDWEEPEATPVVKNALKKKTNVIWAEYQKDKSDTKILLQAERLIDKKGPAAASVSYQFSLPEQIEEGETITICMGTPSQDPEEQAKHGNRAQTLVNRRRLFKLFININPKAKNAFGEPELFQMKVLGNTLSKIRVIAPTLVKKGRRYDILIRYQDQYDNLTDLAPANSQFQFTYDMMRESLNWLLSVPESGYTSLPNLSFNESGTFQIKLINMDTKEQFLSDPVCCHEEAEHSIYWGLLHGESHNYDSHENIEACVRSFRDQHALQFYSNSSPESEDDTSSELWKKVSDVLDSYNDTENFATFTGFQWASSEKGEGLRQIIYSKPGKPLMRNKEGKNQLLAKLYKSLPQKEFLSIPSFTMSKDNPCTFSAFDPEAERVVEIYNAWGSSECSKSEGNPRPIEIKGEKKESANEKGSIRSALRKNCRFGFIAGGLDDRYAYKNLFEREYVHYSPGLTAVITTELTKEKIFEALKKRKCYATTGARIIVQFHVSQIEMGDVGSTEVKPGLAAVRFVSAHIAGTTELKTVEIFRNGELFKTYHPNSFKFDVKEVDTSPIESIMLESPDDRPPFIFYYIRAIQKDGHIAWSTPVWIDHSLYKKPAKKK